MIGEVETARGTVYGLSKVAILEFVHGMNFRNGYIDSISRIVRLSGESHYRDSCVPCASPGVAERPLAMFLVKKSSLGYWNSSQRNRGNHSERDREFGFGRI